MMKIAELQKIWKEFENIPINSADEIEVDFYWWKKSTCRFDVWRWFDENLPNGLVADFHTSA